MLGRMLVPFNSIEKQEEEVCVCVCAYVLVSVIANFLGLTVLTLC